MQPNNSFIADQFSLLSKLMDIHGENSFKAKSYSIASFTIDKLPQQLLAIPQEDIFTIKGIGDAIGKKIIALLETGELIQLNELIAKTPPGVIEMLKIKGLGPKKISTIWKEMGIESVGELLYACNENRLILFKGFGERTQESVKESIEFYLKSQGSYLYAEAEPIVARIIEKWKEARPNELLEISGAFREQMEVINELEWLTTAPPEELDSFFEIHLPGMEKISEEGDRFSFKTKEGFRLEFTKTDRAQFAETLSRTPSPAAAPGVIQVEDIKGIIHSHSDWSDGSQTIEEMAQACIAKNFDYLVISDHSRSAGYANGLNIDRVQQQQEYIDKLNKKLAPFRIFKSIESDILNDGSLDYPDEVLASFDLVIASVHSNLKMTEEKAMMRLMKAIENPYTTILGHLTGRLLLSRSGYPVDHEKIIDACVANNVVIELNAHPRRLDIDWRWIPYALEKGALLSIDPDAHSTDGFNDIKYGVLAAQKGNLTRKNNLSSYNLEELTQFLG